jgi:aspartate aminotransferase-like enzyme
MLESKSVHNIMRIDDLLAGDLPLLMGAGPVPLAESVARANTLVINHLGDTMHTVLTQLVQMAAHLFQSPDATILGVAGPASAALEMAVSNLVTPGMRVLSVCNGQFGKRIAEMATRAGGDVACLIAEPFCAVDPDDVASELRRGRYDLLTICHGETSHTVHNVALPEICRLARAQGCLVLVDAVCTLGAMPFQMADWHIDAAVVGGQKALGAIPGVSLAAFSPRAWKRIEARRDIQPHWCLDAKLAADFWLRRAYHYTAPVPGLLALHEALRLYCEETPEQRFFRHRRCSHALQAGLQALGFSFAVDPRERLQTVLGVCLPNGIDSSALRASMSRESQVDISGAFGLDIVRIGQMAEQCRPPHLLRTLRALASALAEQGFVSDLGAALAVTQRLLKEERPAGTYRSKHTPSDRTRTPAGSARAVETQLD